jgi:CHAT domain-containing protein
MRTIAVKCRKVLFIWFFLSILFGLPADAQTAGSEKLGEADKTYGEAYALIEKRTAEAYRRALTKFQTANRLYAALGEKNGIAKSFVGMGFASDALGAKAEAVAFYEQALPLFRETGNKYWEARTLNNIGGIYDELCDNELALEYLFKALPLRRSALDLNGEAVTLNFIGAAFSKLGENERALDYYNRALQVRNSASIEDDRHNRNGKAIILNNLGRVYDELGNEEKAVEFYNQSLPIRRGIGDRLGEATTLNNIGLIYDEAGEREKALEFYKRALSILSEIGNEERKASLLNNMGTVYAALGENRKALEVYGAALDLHRKFKNRSGEATTLNNIGFARSNLGENSKAFENFNQALVILRNIGEKSVEAITLHNLMLGWRDAGNKPLAVFYGKQSVNKYQELRRAIKNLDPATRKKYLRTVEATYRGLADLLIETGRFAQAERVLRMLKEEEYFDFVRRDPDEIKTLGARVPLTEKEKRLIERYALLAERISELGREMTALEDRPDKQRELPAQKNERRAELEKDLADADAAFRLFLEKELVEEFGAEQTAGVEYDRSLQTKLKEWGEGTVALYTVVTENRYRVILTTPNIQIDGKTEISAADLNKKVFAYRDALRNIETDPRPLAKELYDILIKPVEKDLQAANARTLVWSLDGTLRYIPVATLSPDGKSYLIEKYRNVVTTPATREDVSDSDAEWRALGVGVSESSTIENPENPDELIKFSPIPGTRTELMRIVRDENQPSENGILSGRRFLDKDFTIKSLADSLAEKNPAGRRKYTAVHIASHFQLGSNWTNSFLLLGNGQILTLKDLKNSNAIDFGGVELVTLSACDTASATDSNGKEIDSLAEVIQLKNGKAVLAALWAVADESTPLLMSEFYRLRKENPRMTKAEAMQRAQAAFLTGEIKPAAEYIEKLEDFYKTRTGASFRFDPNAPFAHPYFWSPFVLIGNWR